MRLPAMYAACLLLATTLVSAGSPTSASTECTAVNAQLRTSEPLHSALIRVDEQIEIEPIRIGDCLIEALLHLASCEQTWGEIGVHEMRGDVSINRIQGEIYSYGATVLVTGRDDEETAVIGTGTLAPDVANGESCGPGVGADVFTFTGRLCVDCLG